MSDRDRQRLADIQAAIDAIRSHLQRGDLTGGLIFDAVRIRLLEIGEAVKALPDDLLATQPSIPWRQITRMRDHLAHRYFDTAHAILQAPLTRTCPTSNVQSKPWPGQRRKKTQTRIPAPHNRPSRIPGRLPRAWPPDWADWESSTIISQGAKFGSLYAPALTGSGTPLCQEGVVPAS